MADLRDIDSLTQSFQYLFEMPDELLEQVLDKQGSDLIKAEFTRPEVVKQQLREFEAKHFLREDIIEQKQEFLQSFEEMFSGVELSPAQKRLMDMIVEGTTALLDKVLESYGIYDAEIPIQLLHDDAKVPVYAHMGDQGADVFAVEEIIVPANSFGNKIRTGLAVAIPQGWALAVRPRSGVSAKTRLRVSNSPGTIDGGYRDEIGLLLDNFGEAYTIKPGDRICQLILEKIYTARWIVVDDVKKIGEDRGGGFGSTGK